MMVKDDLVQQLMALDTEILETVKRLQQASRTHIPGIGD